MKKKHPIEDLLIPVNKAGEDELARRKRERLSGDNSLNRHKKENALKQADTTYCPICNDQSDLEPPWVTIPGIAMGDMFWNMGGGEDVSYKFQMRYRALPKFAKEEFGRLYPEPKEWAGWYEMIS